MLADGTQTRAREAMTTLCVCSRAGEVWGGDVLIESGRATACVGLSIRIRLTTLFGLMLAHIPSHGQEGAGGGHQIAAV
jgi:hypothetical protein